MLQRWALRREKFGAVFCNVHIVLKPDAECTANVDARLIAECHVGRELGAVPAYQIRPFMAVHPDAVSHPVREELVVRPVACIGDDFACGGVNRTTLMAACAGPRQFL